MIPEQRDEKAYRKMNRKCRFLIRVIIFLVNILHRTLKPYRFSPIFAIYDIDAMEAEDEKEKESVLQ